MGLILEDVDGFAGDIAHRHTRDESTSQVTASVDQITWLASPPEGKGKLQCMCSSFWRANLGLEFVGAALP